MPRMTRFLCLAIATLVLFPVPVQASDNYPNRPIRLIVGFAAGSSGDVAARIIGHTSSATFWDSP